MVHPAVLKVYNDNKIEYIKRAEDRWEEWFLQKTANQPKKLEIKELWRTRLGGFDTQEYLWWKQTTFSADYKGNKISLFSIVGKYDLPIPFYGFDDNLGASKAIGIQSHEEVFEITFSQEKLDELLANGMITGHTRFAIQSLTRNYGDFDWEDFRDRSFAELVFHGKTGLWPVAPANYNNNDNTKESDASYNNYNEERQRKQEEERKRQKVIDSAKKELEAEQQRKIALASSSDTTTAATTTTTTTVDDDGGGSSSHFKEKKVTQR